MAHDELQNNKKKVRVRKKQNGGRPRGTGDGAGALDSSPSLLPTSPSFSSLYLKSAGAGFGIGKGKKKKGEHAFPLRCPARPPTARAPRIPLIPPPARRSATCPQTFRADAASQTLVRQRRASRREVRPLEGGLVAVGPPAGVRARALAVGVGRQRRAVPGHPSGQVGRLEDLVADCRRGLGGFCEYYLHPPPLSSSLFPPLLCCI